METFWTYFEVLAPSVGVGLVFWLAIRSIFRADRRERAMEAQVREEVLGGAGDGQDRRNAGESTDPESSEEAESQNGEALR